MKTLNSKKTCLFRVTAADRKKLETLLFRRYPRQEWGTFFRFGYRVTPWGLHVTFVDALAPRAGDLNRNSPIVAFDADYILRAQLALSECELGIGVAHSHPQNCDTSASNLDNDMDSYFSSEFARYGNGRPYVTLRLARHQNGSFVFSGEAWHNGEPIPVTDLCTVGASLMRETAEFSIARKTIRDLEGWTERADQLFENTQAAQKSSAFVGIIGCSGTGSPAVHALARAGYQRFLLVDPKIFTRSNHERFHASSWRDLDRKQLKVELIREMILEINPAAEITMLNGNVLDDEVLDEILRCDLILCCTDSQHSRAALSDYATHYLLPCIDSAVLMRAEEGKLTEQVAEFVRYSPDEPCAWCLDRINQKALDYEMMSKEERQQRKQAAEEAVRQGIDGAQYWSGEPAKELTVGYMTSAVGALQAGYAQGWLTGAFQMPHQRFQFDIGIPLLGTVPSVAEWRHDCSCYQKKGWSDQARADRSVSRPWHWPKAKP